VRQVPGDDERRLYELVWKRAVASQMVPAILNTVSVELAAGNQHSFRASGTTVIDPGFLAVYEEGKDANAARRGRGRKLPPMKLGQNVPLSSIHTDQHFTEPPPRFSEASLVKALEEYGIGRRPPTPASSRSAVPRLRAARQQALPAHRRRPRGQQLPDQPLHAIRRLRLHGQARGTSWTRWSRGRGGLDPAAREISGSRSRRPSTDKSESVDRTEATGARLLGNDPKTGKPINARLGRYGPFVQIGTAEDEEKPDFASLRPGQSMHTITPARSAETVHGAAAQARRTRRQELTVASRPLRPVRKRGDTYASLGKEGRSVHHSLRTRRGKLDPRPRQELIANPPDQGVRRQPDPGVNGKYGAYNHRRQKNGQDPERPATEVADREECEAILLAAPVRPHAWSLRQEAPAKKAAKKVARRRPMAKGRCFDGKAPAKKAAKKATRKVCQEERPRRRPRSRHQVTTAKKAIAARR
jgi:DNA topoisomerase-1